MAHRLGNSLVYVIGSLDVGGAERHLATVAQAMVEAGRDVTIYCLTHRGVMADEVEAKGVRVVCSARDRSGGGMSRRDRAIRFASAITNLVVLLRRHRPRIAHFFLPGSYLLGAPAAIATGVPIRIMSRRSNNNYQSARPLAARVERLLHPRMSAVLGNSRAVVDDLLAEGCSPDQLGLLYNGVNLDLRSDADLRQEKRRELGIAPESLIVACVANLIPYKGHRDLLAALAMSRAELPDKWQLLCVGRDDGIEEALRQQAEASGIGGNVRFLGSRSDVPGLLAAADIGVLTSHEEGFSNAVIEMMAARLACIVTDVGGNAEAVRDGIGGLVVPPNAPDAIAAALMRLARDSDERREMAKAARARVEAHFSLAACIDGYDQLYRALEAGQLIGRLERFACNRPSQ